MTKLKMYVQDYGGQGAGLYFAKSLDEAVEYFRSGELKRLEAFLAQHLKYQKDDYQAELTRKEIERTKQDDYKLTIDEYEIVQGKFYGVGGD